MKINNWISQFKYLMIIFLVFVQCTHQNDNQTNNTLKNDNLIKINIDTLKDSSTILFSNVFKGFKLLPLETKNECLIGDISHLEYFNNVYYVLDSSISKGLFLFDENGNFIKKIGSVGKGPGEYLLPIYFSIDPATKNIFILDGQQSKLIKYSEQGQYIEQIPVPSNNHSSHISSFNKIIYLDNNISPFYKHDNILSSLNEAGKVSGNWFPNMQYRKGYMQTYNNSGYFFRSENDIKYANTFYDTIFSINNEIIKPHIVLSTENIISKEEVSKMNLEKELIKFQYEFYSCRKFMGVTDYVESSGLTFFTYRNNRTDYHLFYYPNNSSLHCTTNLIDDLTKQTIFFKFYFAYKNYFITCIQNDFTKGIEELIKNINEKKIKLTIKDEAVVKNLTINSNPVIVIYECKEKFE